MEMDNVKETNVKLQILSREGDEYIVRNVWSNGALSFPWMMSVSQVEEMAKEIVIINKD